MTKVVVVGGGIGGLATAIALKPTGIETVVLEQASDLSRVEVGAGITLWPNAVEMLDRLGVGDQVREAGSLFTGQLEQRTADGRLLAGWHLNEFADALGASPMGIRRPVLHGILAAAANEHVKAGSKATGFEEDDSEVRVTLADGRVEAGSALIGADGIDSVIRAQLHGAELPRFSGLVIWRAVTKFDDDALPPGALLSLWGTGTRFVAFRVAEGTFSWEATLAADAGGSDPPEGAKPQLLELFAHYRDPVRQLVESTEEPAIVRNDVCDRPPTERWGGGRVTLLGDAAHAMTFAVGQGAAQALEDAVTLGSALAAGGDVEAGLRTYEQKRIKRAAHFQSMAWRLARMGLARNPLKIATRNAFMRLTSRTGKRLQVRDLRVPD